LKLNKKIKKLLITSIIVLSLIVALAFVTSQKHKVLCSEIKITILDSSQNYFIDKNDVLELIYEDFGNVVGYSFDSINIASIELKLSKNPFIENVEVFKTLHGKLNVDIKQRNPILRVINSKGQSFYIGQEGVIMPSSSKYTSLEILANGYIPASYKFADTINLPLIDENFDDKLIFDLFTLAKFINSDNFYLALIDQIYVNENHDFELVPKIGNHIVEFGDISNYEEKLRNLEIFYKKGITKLGWNRYSKISLKYENQIVCTLK
jgi:cell division protein FtsQ